MPSPADPIAISIGGFDLRWYALFILLGIFSAIALSTTLANIRSRTDPMISGEFLLDMAPVVVVAGIIGARLYYVLLKFDYFVDHPSEAFNIRTGGMTIHGAIVVGSLAAWVYCRANRQSLATWADLIVPGVALGQAIGRWGNWANQEAFGTPSSLPWAVEIRPDRRPDAYTRQPTFHPTFLYESLFNLANAILLSWLVVRAPRLAWLRPGDVAGIYLILYGIARLAIESIRTDSLYIGPLPAAYWFSGALIVAGTAILTVARLKESA